MTPEAARHLLDMAHVMRRRTPIQNLLGDVTRCLLAAVPADGVRYDLGDDSGRLWSRVVRAGQDPERPELGSVPPVRSKESLTRSEQDGVHGISIPLGLGETPTGRLVLKRRQGPFSDEEVAVLQRAADLISLGLRSRPFDPPPKPRNPFEDEGPLV
ncbi:MAG: hypothetical protein HY716_09660 [Planctomycetes bacterium]|nr:hypothetical protein [Planctomycetota bacterium]